MSRPFAVFDLETNGFHGSSVLSASSIVFTAEGRILDFHNRFYYPEERPDRRTEAVHGLSLPRIGALRGEEEYPSSFLEDWTALALFWERWNPKGIVVHNLPFDIGFLPGSVTRAHRWWCSMRGLAEFCRLTGRSPSAGRWKLPRLGEAVAAVRKTLPCPSALRSSEEIVGKSLQHYGLSDCFELYGLSVRLLGGAPSLVQFRPVSSSLCPPERAGYPVPSPIQDLFVRERLAYSARVAKATAAPMERERLTGLGEETLLFRTPPGTSFPPREE